jgi:hypothetical protein
MMPGFFQRAADAIGQRLVTQPDAAAPAVLREAAAIVTNQIQQDIAIGALPPGRFRVGGIVANETSAALSINEQVWTIWVEHLGVEMPSTTGRIITSSTTAVSDPCMHIELRMNSGYAITIDGDRQWIEWNRPYTCASTSTIITTHAEVWREWVRLRPEQILPPVRVSEEERARRQAEEQRWREAEEKRRQEQAEADTKAETLLRACLTAEQNEDLQKKGCFYLYVGDKKYRVKRGYAGNVELVDSKDDRTIHRYCIHPQMRVPDADAMLAQKCMLEANEAEFLRIANRHF